MTAPCIGVIRAHRSVRLALWGLLFAGTLIRLPHLVAPPLEFHATRQYRSAALARGYVIDALPGYSAQEHRAAVLLAAQMAPIEPPVFENAAALLYRMAGREALWMPRLLGVLAWTGGAVAMWWLVAPLLGALAGLAAVAVFLFLPYGVPASQAFQPDGLMTVLTVAAIAASFRRHCHPSTRAARVATLVAAAAVFIKPMAAFFVLPVEVSLSTSRDGWLRGLRRSALWAAAVAMLAAAWYVYVTMTSASVFEDRFFPQLLTRSVFWTDWLRMIERVVPWPALVLAILGVITARGATRRGLLAAWMGYVTYGLLFSYHIHTHDYYSLPLIPLVGWSVGALVSAVWARRCPAGPRHGRSRARRLPGLGAGRPLDSAGLGGFPESRRRRGTSRGREVGWNASRRGGRAPECPRHLQLGMGLHAGSRGRPHATAAFDVVVLCGGWRRVAFKTGQSDAPLSRRLTSPSG